MKYRRAASLLPVVGGILAASALTGAAVFTVSQVDCDGGQLIQHGNNLELVGGCIHPDDISPNPDAIRR